MFQPVRSLFSFLRLPLFGGIHPPDSKEYSRSSPIEELPVKDGELFYFSLTQHIGSPAKPIVTKGQEVSAGQLIAESTGFISSNIHSSVTGTVVSLSKVDFPVSGSANCIVVQAKGDQLYSSSYNAKPSPAAGTSLADIVKAAGIVGMGGAMFPTHVKLAPKEKLHTLIVNGAECEPYLTCDHRNMIENAYVLIKGAELIKKGLSLDNIIFAVEDNKPDAITSLIKAAEGKPYIQIKSLATLYPQGGEKQLILSTLGIEVPEGKLPSVLGVIVQNVSTVIAIYNAVVLGVPLTYRVITVTKDVASPKNIFAPIGTPISRLIDFCGGVKNGEFPKEVVLGGPITGFSAISLNVPVYKGMNGVIVTSSHSKKSSEKPVLPCIRCGSCIRACPSGLSPLMFENFYKLRDYESLHEWKLLSCIECNACSYICPSARPLKTEFSLGKKRVSQINAEKLKGGK